MLKASPDRLPALATGALLVAGGTNFSEKKPWEGGTKVWYERGLCAGGVQLRSGRSLANCPRPLGYGVSVTYNDGFICVGGSDRDRHYRRRLSPGVVERQIENLILSHRCRRQLRIAVAQWWGDPLYTAGGLEKPDAAATSKRAWQIDLRSKSPKWKEMKPGLVADGCWPSPRVSKARFG